MKFYYAIALLLFSSPLFGFVLLRHDEPQKTAVIAVTGGGAHHIRCTLAKVEELPSTLAGLTQYCGNEASDYISEREYLESLFAHYRLNAESPSLDLSEWAVRAEREFRMNSETPQESALPNVMLLIDSVGRFLGPQEHREVTFAPGRTLGSALVDSFEPIYFDGRSNWALHPGGKCHTGWVMSSLRRALAPESYSGLRKWLTKNRIVGGVRPEQGVAVWHGSFRFEMFQDKRVSVYQRDELYLLIERFEPLAEELSPMNSALPNPILEAFVLPSPMEPKRALCWRPATTTPARSDNEVSTGTYSAETLATSTGLKVEDWRERLSEHLDELTAQAPFVLFDQARANAMELSLKGPSGDRIRKALFAGVTSRAEEEAALRNRIEGHAKKGEELARKLAESEAQSNAALAVFSQKLTAKSNLEQQATTIRKQEKFFLRMEELLKANQLEINAAEKQVDQAREEFEKSRLRVEEAQRSLAEWKGLPQPK